MTNKTCGECRYHKNNRCMLPCHTINHPAENSACHRFEVKTPPTNGDVIRQGSNKALVIFKAQWDCNTCAYHIPKGDNNWARCKRPKDKTCIDGMLAWLNAPAESEGKDE